MRTYGLLGKTLKHSFSPSYFTEKFKAEGINAQYLALELHEISELKPLLEQYQFSGLNVTIPYKEAVIPYLNELSTEAKEIGAVNTIVFKDGRLIGHNSDVHGFKRSLAAVLKSHHERALILGTGGASKAVVYVLKELGVDYKLVSRQKSDNQFTYSDINEYVLRHFKLIVNTTPLGTFPDINQAPDLPYEYLNKEHLLYDLVYNPAETLFLKKGQQKNVAVLNGHRMLLLQAEKSWELWNK